MFNTSNGYSLSDIAAATGSNNGNNCNDGFGGNNAWWIILLFICLFGGWGNNGWGNRDNNGSNGGSTTREEIAYGFDMNGLENATRGIQQGLCDGFYAMNTGILNGFAGVNNAICDLGYSTQQGFNNTNVALMQGQNALSTQLAQCCCDTRAAIQDANYNNAQGQAAISREIADCCCKTGQQIERGFADINYNMATNTCALQTSMANNTRDIIDNQNAGTRAILDYLCQEKISDLQAENQGLRLAASQQAQNNYLVSQLAPKLPVPSYQVPNPFVPYGYNNGCCGNSYNNCGSCC